MLKRRPRISTEVAVVSVVVPIRKILGPQLVESNLAAAQVVILAAVVPAAILLAAQVVILAAAQVVVLAAVVPAAILHAAQVAPVVQVIFQAQVLLKELLILISHSLVQISPVQIQVPTNRINVTSVLF